MKKGDRVLVVAIEIKGTIRSIGTDNDPYAMVTLDEPYKGYYSWVGSVSFLRLLEEPKGNPEWADLWDNN